MDVPLTRCKRVRTYGTGGVPANSADRGRTGRREARGKFVVGIACCTERGMCTTVPKERRTNNACALRHYTGARINVKEKIKGVRRTLRGLRFKRKKKKKRERCK